ncbi:hypothetical protein Cni_G29527 [Canna indica]|uniref:RanBP2-type domain-containing protein n=1 Tax=Canna indica TaxID=4628 RepID=A0AAQ3QPN7_9LILI|nr:hypothetical protein Cni_G29527 [Canna indica]
MLCVSTKQQINRKLIMSRKSGDWICRSCQYDNFCWRDSCQRCKKAKLGSANGTDDHESSSTTTDQGWDVKPGDWYCSCGVINYASRPSCFKCSASKDASASAVAQSWGSASTSPSQPGWKSGDWICTRSVDPSLLPFN